MTKKSKTLIIFACLSVALTCVGLWKRAELGALFAPRYTAKVGWLNSKQGIQMMNEYEKMGVMSKNDYIDSYKALSSFSRGEGKVEDFDLFVEVCMRNIEKNKHNKINRGYVYMEFLNDVLPMKKRSLDDKRKEQLSQIIVSILNEYKGNEDFNYFYQQRSIEIIGRQHLKNLETLIVPYANSPDDMLQKATEKALKELAEP